MMFGMRMPSSVLAGCVVLAVGCVDEPSRTEPPNLTCVECSPGGGGDGDGDGDGGQGAGGQGATPGSVVGTVVLLATSTFDQVVAYDGAATVSALDADLSSLAEDTVAGGADGTFQLDDIPEGPFWLFTRDDTGGATGVTSTYTLQIAPTTVAQAPVADLAVLTTIGQGLLPPVLPTTNDAQVFVSLQRGGVALSDVEVVGLSSAEAVAFDNGPSDFASGAQRTGSYGRIVVLNLSVSGQRLFTLDLVDGDGIAVSVEMPVAAGATTVVGFEI